MIFHDNRITKEEAENIVKSILIQKETFIQKEAQADIATVNKGDQFQDGKLNSDKRSGQTFMHYYIDTPYVSGKRVKLHSGGAGGNCVGEGLGFESIEGNIVSSQNNRVIVEWTSGKYKGKRTGFDLADAARLAQLEILN